MSKRRLLLNNNQIETYKWIQTAVDSVFDDTGSDLIVPTIGSVVFTPSEMTIGSVYKVYFNIAGNAFSTGTTDLDIVFGSSIVTLFAGGGGSFYDFHTSGYIFITFLSGADATRTVRIETDVKSRNPTVGTSFSSYIATATADTQFEDIVVDTTSNKSFNLRSVGTSSTDKYMKYSHCEKII